MPVVIRARDVRLGDRTTTPQVQAEPRSAAERLLLNTYIVMVQDAFAALAWLSDHKVGGSSRT